MGRWPKKKVDDAFAEVDKIPPGTNTLTHGKWKVKGKGRKRKKTPEETLAIKGAARERRIKAAAQSGLRDE